MQIAALLLILLIGYQDWRQRRISNELVLSLLLVTTVIAVTSNHQLTAVAINIAFGMAVTIPGYIKSIVGGGDIKLMLSVSPLWPPSQLMMIFASGVLLTAGILYWTDKRKTEIAMVNQPLNVIIGEDKTGLPLGTAMAIGMCLYAAGSALIDSAIVF